MQGLKVTFPVGAFTALSFAIAVFFISGSAPATGHAGLLSAQITSLSTPQEPDPFSVLPAKGKFLVASRNLSDPRFQESVVLIIDYGAKGAAGLIINRPTKVMLAEILPSVPSLKKRADVVYYGGPVEGHRMLLLIRSDNKPKESGHVFGNVYISASKSTLDSVIGLNRPAKQFRMYAGYAGWSAGQLEQEVSRGDWLIVRADASSIFDKKSSEVWRELFRRGSAILVRNNKPDFVLALNTPFP